MADPEAVLDTNNDKVVDFLQAIQATADKADERLHVLLNSATEKEEYLGASADQALRLENYHAKWAIVPVKCPKHRRVVDFPAIGLDSLPFLSRVG